MKVALAALRGPLRCLRRCQSRALAATDAKGALDRGTSVRAVVSRSGPTDLASFYVGHSFVGGYLGCIPSDCPRRYRNASPVSHVDRGDPPFLLANGSADIVPLVQAQRMARRLRPAHVARELIVVAGSRHAGEYATQVWRPRLRFLTRQAAALTRCGSNQV